MRDKARTLLLALLIALAGAATAWLPSLIADLMFLHRARVLSEYQEQLQQQQRAQQSTAPTPSPPLPK